MLRLIGGGHARGKLPVQKACPLSSKHEYSTKNLLYKLEVSPPVIQRPVAVQGIKVSVGAI